MGHLKCPNCKTLSSAWRSSGISECRPHFYCNSCSNVLVRDADKEIIYELGATQRAADKIKPTLPRCDCGDNFKLGANPKCPNCKCEFKNKNSIVGRLNDPHVFMLDGAIMYRDNLFDYQILIDQDDSLEGSD